MSITEHLFHPLINAIGWALLHSLWQILLIALLWKVALQIAKKAGPNIKHNITLTALLMIPAAFCFTLYRQWEVFSNAKRIVSLEFDDTAWLTYGGETSFFMVQKNYPGLLSSFDAYTPIIFMIYIAGLFLFSINGIIGYFRLLAFKHRYSSNIPTEWIEKVSDFIKKAGLKEKVKLFVTSKINIPCVSGFIKPVIMLPVSFFTALSPDQIETIILHELHHIRRKDHLINMLQNILETIFFYHPCTWWISNHLRRERENCVDMSVVKETGKPMTYAQALLKLEEENAQNALQPSLAAISNKNYLLTRIKNIMHMKTSKFNPGQKIATVLVIIAAAVSVAWINPAMHINLFTSAETVIDQYEATTFKAEDTGYAEAIEESKPSKDKEPKIIYFQDGSYVGWQELSDKDREEIQNAIAEARLALEEVNREVFEKLRSEEFKAQMEKVRTDVNEAMQTVNREVFEQLQSEEFKNEIQRAREEVLKAMEELDEKEKQRIREEINQAMKELENVDWAHINNEIHEAMKEVSKAMGEIEEFIGEAGKVMNEVSPIIKDVFKELELDKLFEELNNSLKDLDTLGMHKQ